MHRTVVAVTLFWVGTSASTIEAGLVYPSLFEDPNTGQTTNNTARGTVRELAGDQSSPQLLASYPDFADPQGIAVDPVTGKIYFGARQVGGVGAGSGRLYSMNADGSDLTQLTFGTAINVYRYMEFNGGSLYFADGQYVRRYDLNTDTLSIKADFGAGHQVRGIAFHQEGPDEYLYVTTAFGNWQVQKGTLAGFDPTTSPIVAQGAYNNANGIDVSGSGGDWILYVASGVDRNIALFDHNSAVTPAAIWGTTGSASRVPYGVLVDESSNSLFVSVEDDGAHGTLQRFLLDGSAPYDPLGIAATPVGIYDMELTPPGYLVPEPSTLALFLIGFSPVTAYCVHKRGLRRCNRREPTCPRSSYHSE